jgi:predicted mannosyl-3-phosphoglycerate phosphatase (HAD superfamily)
MAELNEHIHKISEKLQKLIRQYELLQKDNARQRQLIDGLQKQQAATQENLEMLQQQNLLLKASVNSMSPADKKAMEAKLNQYIKNIDKCISLISQ